MSNDSKKLFVISGSSGVGKGTVIKSLLAKHSDIKLSISYTTRSPRAGEEEGVNYFFRTKEEFMKAVENDEFLEWAEFSGNCYGTKRKFVEKSLNNGEHVLLEIDTQGALQIKKKMPEAVLLFIAPPSYEELEARLRGRKTETEEAIQKRLKFVEFEKENSKYFDYIIINDTVENAVNEIEKHL
ncbi:MAG: guanylate kinase [Cyanobacteria bacterium RUI128]|nr:guanylate kinase [Cyanobacteria bacterium RUI128]